MIMFEILSPVAFIYTHTFNTLGDKNSDMMIVFFLIITLQGATRDIFYTRVTFKDTPVYL